MQRARILLAASGVLSLLLLVSSCSNIDPDAFRAPSKQQVAIQHGPLAEVRHRVAQRFGTTRSGFLLLPDNQPALQWRLALADSAQRSIDAQYFLWESDHSGTLLLDRLLKAADRGVRVRLLVDDIFVKDRDASIAAICRHPNFEIRLFNPNPVRQLSSIPKAACSSTPPSSAINSPASSKT